MEQLLLTAEVNEADASISSPEGSMNNTPCKIRYALYIDRLCVGVKYSICFPRMLKTFHQPDDLPLDTVKFSSLKSLQLVTAFAVATDCTNKDHACKYGLSERFIFALLY